MNQRLTIHVVMGEKVKWVPLNQQDLRYTVYGLYEPGAELPRYVGVTGRPDLGFRLKEHLTIDCRFHKGSWINTLKEKGVVPEIRSIETGIDQVTAFTKEKEYIALYRKQGVKLTNITAGGIGGLGTKKSEEECQKMSERQKGEGNSFFNKKHTPENVAKIRERTKGVNNGFFGKKHTEETRLKIKEKRALQIMPKGRVMSEEQKAYISRLNTGRVRSEELKKQISDKLKGRTRVFTEEHKRNISEGRKRFLANKNRQNGTIEFK